jgi:biotin operon repressor
LKKSHKHESQRSLFQDPKPRTKKARVTVGRQTHEAVHPFLDRPRLENQEMKVLYALTDKKWHTLFEIAAAWGIPHGSVGSQIRNLRVDGWFIEKVRVGQGGTWAYRLIGKKDEQAVASGAGGR